MRGDLPFPVAVLKETALAHNLAWMADFTRATGVLLAPHGKTTMAPQLFARQIEAGAWGITFATMQQVSVGVASGLRRIILANQLIGREDIAQARHLVASTPGLELHFLIDSIAGLELLEGGSAPRGQAPLNALLEMGLAGSRTGCRTADEAMRLARAMAASPAVRLSGVECFEGLSVTGDGAADPIVVDRWIRAVQEVARQCDAEELYGTPEITLSAGGSAVFDLVARGLPMQLSRPVRTILRSGCYVTHDSGFYERFLRHVIARSGAPWSEREALKPALEVWTQIQSRPEPDLAILAFGKRDASFDLELPDPACPCARWLAHHARRKLADRKAQRSACLPATAGGRRCARRRPRRLRDFPSLHDVRQVALDAGRRRQLRRHGRHPDLLLIAARSFRPSARPAGGQGCPPLPPWRRNMGYSERSPG